MSAPKAGHQTKGSRKGARHQDKRLTPSWFRIPATRRWESDLYVAGRRPDPSRLEPLASIIYSTILGAGTHPAAARRPLRGRRHAGGGEAAVRGGSPRPRAHGERRRLAGAGAAGADLRAGA